MPIKELIIGSCDFAPKELVEIGNFRVRIVRGFNVPEVLDCLVCSLHEPIDWNVSKSRVRKLNHIIIAPRWHGTRIEEGIDSLPINLACVIDDTIADDLALDPKKVKGCARALATDALRVTLDRKTYGNIARPPWWLLDSIN